SSCASSPPCRGLGATTYSAGSGKSTFHACRRGWHGLRKSTVACPAGLWQDPLTVKRRPWDPEAAAAAFLLAALVMIAAALLGGFFLGRATKGTKPVGA